jgi:hypothetical protein
MNKYSKTKKSPQVSDKALKEFGLLMSWAFPLFIGVIAPWILGLNPQWWSLWVSFFFIIFAFLAPKVIYLPFKSWMFIGGIIGFINTRIILGLTFYLLIFPTGLVLRGLNKLQFKKQNKSCSNYIKRTDKLTKDELENPF